MLTLTRNLQETQRLLAARDDAYWRGDEARIEYLDGVICELYEEAELLRGVVPDGCPVEMPFAE